MKYIIYYLTPKRKLYELLKDTMSITVGTLKSIKTVGVDFFEFERLSKEDILRYIQKYIDNDKTLKYLDTNLLAIIGIVLAIIGIIF